jgi:ribonuclease HII
VSSKTFPSLSLETQLFESGARFVIGIDEVGRGALAGPVSVGVAVLSITDSTVPWPKDLADSKLMSERSREANFEPVAEWVSGWAVGSASNAEIDANGIVASLSLAAVRAVKSLPAGIRAEIAAAAAEPNAVVAILDGSHNWLGNAISPVTVKVQTKADRDCAVVAAASVLAKVTRDREMISLTQESPVLSPYGLASNKGYSSQSHIDALREIGPSVLHRQSWLGKILGDSALF